MRHAETREQELEVLDRKIRLLSRRIQCAEDIIDRELREMWDELADIDARLSGVYPTMSPAELDAELKRLNGME